MLDRFDLQIEVQSLTGTELDAAAPSESSTAVAARVAMARERQARRGWLNAAMPTAALRAACAADDVARRLAREAIDRAGYSARAVTRALRVARTIADLAGEPRVSADALAEALQHRAYEGRRFATR